MVQFTVPYFTSGLQWAETAVLVEFDKFLSDTETRQNHEQSIAFHNFPAERYV